MNPAVFLGALSVVMIACASLCIANMRETITDAILAVSMVGLCIVLASTVLFV